MAGEFAGLFDFDFPDFPTGGGGDGGFDFPDVPEPVGGIPTPAPGGDGGGGGFGDLVKGVKDIGGDIGKGVQGILDPIAGLAKPLLPLAGLATAGMGIASGVQGAKQAAAQRRLQQQGQRMQQQSAERTSAAAAPLTQFGQEQLDQAKAGQIPASIQAKINEWKTGYLAAIRDRLARSGQGNSQALMQWEQWVEQQAKAMEATYLQEEQRMGMQGLTQGAQVQASAGGQAGNLAGGAASEQSAIDNLMKQANEVLSRLNAGAA